MPEKLKFLKRFREFYIPILVLLLIGFAFFTGALWQKVKNLEKGSAGSVTKTNEPAPSQPTVSLDQIKDLFKKDLIKFGDENRKVLFVEVSDPSCPYCDIASGLNSTLNAQVNPPQFKLVKDGGTYVAPVSEMRKLVEAGKASFVWIYFPGHGNGEMGTKALYCAYEKGKFWQVHDLLMTDKGYNLLNNTLKNDKTKSGELATFLKSAVDSTFLKECLDSGKYDARLASDTQLAQPLFPPQGGTPNFFVNDTNFDGAHNYKDMQSAVDAALK